MNYLIFKESRFTEIFWFFASDHRSIKVENRIKWLWQDSSLRDFGAKRPQIRPGMRLFKFYGELKHDLPMEGKLGGDPWSLFRHLTDYLKHS